METVIIVLIVVAVLMILFFPMENRRRLAAKRGQTGAQGSSIEAALASRRRENGVRSFAVILVVLALICAVAAGFVFPRGEVRSSVYGSGIHAKSGFNWAVMLTTFVSGAAASAVFFAIAAVIDRQNETLDMLDDLRRTAGQPPAAGKQEPEARQPAAGKQEPEARQPASGEIEVTDC